MDNNTPKVGDFRLSPATLTAWRDRMGYSQREAADILGCSLGSWAEWEQGSRKIPRYIGLACAALALGMTPYGDDRKDE